MITKFFFGRIFSQGYNVSIAVLTAESTAASTLNEEIASALS